LLLSTPNEFAMSTTTIRLPDDLKAKIAEEAAVLGTTPHHFMLEAITEKLNLADRKKDFERTATKRFDNIVKTGQAISWEDMQRYLRAKANGLKKEPKAARPASRRISSSTKTSAK